MVQFRLTPCSLAINIKCTDYCIGWVMVQFRLTPCSVAINIKKYSLLYRMGDGAV